MKRRRFALAGALVGAALAGSVITIALWGGDSVTATTGPPSVAMTTVVRTNLAASVLAEGTLGYASTDPIVNRLTGTYTALPAFGALIRRGDALYRVDNLPVVLMAGPTPAWRMFALGMTDGPDVKELQANLIASGDAAGLFTAPTGHFDVFTAYAVEHWQSRYGYPRSGQIALGQVVFLPHPILVGAENVARGQAAASGDIPFDVTSTSRVVTVPVTPSLPSVHVGEAVSIVLPAGATTRGKINAIGPVPPANSSTAQSSTSSDGTLSSAQQSQASALLFVTPRHPAATGHGSGVAVQVSLTTQSARDVLAVPISALLALSGGGYGVEVVGSSGAHHLVGVATGIFTGSQVQISGSGIEVGTKVVVAQ